MTTPTITTLSNGIRVALVPVPGARTAAIEGAIRGGPAFESMGNVGVGHLAEHMLLRRTARRSAEELGLELDRLANDHDGATSAESVTLSLPKVRPEDVGQAVALVGEIVTSPRFDALEVTGERRVVLLEVRGGLNDEGGYGEVGDLLHATAIDGPLGLPTLGTPRTVATFTPADLAGWHRTHCTGANIALAIAGNVDVEAVSRAVEGAFGSIPSGVRLMPNPCPVSQTCPRIRVVGDVEEGVDRNPGALVQVGLGLRGDFGRADRRADALEVLAGILDGGASSRMFSALRLRSSLAREFCGMAHSYQGASLLELSATVEGRDARRAAGVLLGLLADLGEHGPTAGELETYRRRIRGEVAALSVAEVANAAADRLLHGETGTDEDEAERFCSVTADAIRAVAVELLRPDRLSLAAVGEIALEDLEEVVDRWRQGLPPPEPTVDPRVFVEAVGGWIAASPWRTAAVAGAGIVALTMKGKPKHPR